MAFLTQGSEGILPVSQLENSVAVGLAEQKHRTHKSQALYFMSKVIDLLRRCLSTTPPYMLALAPPLRTGSNWPGVTHLPTLECQPPGMLVEVTGAQWEWF